MKFKKTEITYDELTEWILKKYKKFKITEIRYFGSRVFGSPHEDSDIDVYILTKKSINGRPLWSDIYNGLVIEFHEFLDMKDGYIPSWLIGKSTKNEIQRRQRIFP